jgi:hypothetical protein
LALVTSIIIYVIKFQILVATLTGSVISGTMKRGCGKSSYFLPGNGAAITSNIRTTKALWGKFAITHAKRDGLGSLLFNI